MSSASFPANCDIFISYCWKKNKEKVHEMHKKLSQKFPKIWIDINEMDYGDLNEMMSEGISQSKVFICCLTEEYCKSKNCMKEFNFADKLRKPIVYVIFEEIGGLTEPEITKKFSPVSFTMGSQMFYKHQKFDEILAVIGKLLVILFFYC